MDSPNPSRPAYHNGRGVEVFHSEQTVPSLSAIPHGVWLAMSVVDLLCSVALILVVAAVCAFIVYGRFVLKPL
jgi:hypothetical protein